MSTIQEIDIVETIYRQLNGAKTDVAEQNKSSRGELTALDFFSHFATKQDFLDSLRIGGTEGTAAFKRLLEAMKEGQKIYTTVYPTISKQNQTKSYYIKIQGYNGTQQIKICDFNGLSKFLEYYISGNFYTDATLTDFFNEAIKTN